MAKFDTLLSAYISIDQVNQVLNGEQSARETVGVAYPPGGNEKAKNKVWLATDRKSGEPRTDKNGRQMYNIKTPSGVSFRIWLNHSQIREAMDGDRPLTKPVGYGFRPGRSQILTVFLQTTRPESEDEEPTVRVNDNGLLGLNVKLVVQDDEE